MSDLSEHVEQLSRIQDAALNQTQRLVQLVADHFKRQDAEMAELRDELLALSNRIEAVTQAAVRGGLLGPGYCGTCHGTGLHPLGDQLCPDCHAAVSG